jgi:DNA-binding response OmpR family regulator
VAANILLAEDDRALSALILDFFHAAGLEVLPVFDGEQALAAAAEQSFDLLILDVMMPHFSGLEVCRRVREDSSVPILFITALSQEENALAGFRAGADDYITKPFSFPVLVAKAQAILRRSRGQSLGAGQLAYGSILLDTALREVTVDGRPIHLRPKEVQILEREQGRTVSRGALIQKVWSLDFDGDERMVDRHVAALRQKLGTAAQHIKSVYGAGYRLGGKEGQR